MIRTLGPALGCFLLATPALADLTAEEVLADHLNLLGGYGLLDMQTTGTTERPNGLSVDGFVGRYADDDTALEIRTPGMVLTETADGSVEITYADNLPITIHADPADKDPVTVTLTLATKALTHRVSGAANDLTHTIAFDTLTIGDFVVDPPEAAEELQLTGDIAIAGFSSVIRLNDGTPVRRSLDLDLAGLTLAMTSLAPTDIGIDTPGTTYDAEGMGEMAATVSLSDLGLRLGFVDGDLPRHSMDMTLGGLQWDQSSDLPEDEGAIDFAISSTDLAISYDLQVIFEGLEDNFLQALLDGQQMSGALNFASLAYDFDIDTPEGTFATGTSTGVSENRFSLSENGIAYYGSAMDSVVEMGGPALGFPINTIGYRVESTLVDLVMPMTPSEEPQPFHLRLGLNGLTVDDALWDIFDNQRRLTRTPVELDVDLSGTTILFDDMFTTNAEPPFLGTEASLNSLRLSVAGAELTGSGNIKDTGTPANPSGVGELNMTLVGINGLIDTLVDMGLLPNEQAMGARMGLGLIARPGDGEDTLISKIEVTEDGQIFANGQRIK